MEACLGQSPRGTVTPGYECPLALGIGSRQLRRQALYPWRELGRIWEKISVLIDRSRQSQRIVQVVCEIEAVCSTVRACASTRITRRIAVNLSSRRHQEGSQAEIAGWLS
jgi:hypothetical protein